MNENEEDWASDEEEDRRRRKMDSFSRVDAVDGKEAN